MTIPQSNILLCFVVKLYCVYSSQKPEPVAPKPAPKKLAVDWSAKTQERAAKNAEDQPVTIYNTLSISLLHSLYSIIS